MDNIYVQIEGCLRVHGHVIITKHVHTNANMYMDIFLY